MTDQRFDELTKSLGKSTTRRSMLKALAGTAMGGVFMRFGRRSANAATRRPACARLNESCTTLPCCAGHGTCNSGVCCKTAGVACSQHSDCCGGNICRQQQTGRGTMLACGAGCLVDTDCPEGQVCDTETNTCEEAPPPVVACDDDTDCVGTDYCGPNLGDGPPMICTHCGQNGTFCVGDNECCGGNCNITNGVFGVCQQAVTMCNATNCTTPPASTGHDLRCVVISCNGSTCVYTPVTDDTPCAGTPYGTCQAGVCVDTCLPDDSFCSNDVDCCSGTCEATQPLDPQKRCV